MFSRVSHDRPSTQCDLLTLPPYPRVVRGMALWCLLGVVALPLVGIPMAWGQPATVATDYSGLPAGSAESAIAAELRDQPAKKYEFNRAPLRDVLRMLADDAGISFVSLPDGTAGDNTLVTFTIKASPFQALEIVAKANGVALFYEAGVWYLRPFDDQELVARTYTIKFDTQEEVKYRNQSSGGATSSSSASMGGNTVNGGGGGSGLGQSSSAPDIGLSLDGVTDIFHVEKSESGGGTGDGGRIDTIVKDVKALIGIPTTGFDAPGAGGTAGTVSPNSVQPRSATAKPASVEATSDSEKTGQKVIWNSNSNTLYVVATRQQQGWVKGYLAASDRPQPLIAIEVKFLETTKDPRKQLGLDWTGTLGEGYQVKLSDISAKVNFDRFVNPATTNGSAFVAGTAVLSASDVAVTLRAFLADRDSSTVSYPRVLTRNNREVVIRSVINQPVLAAQSTVTPGVGGTSSSQIVYLPIGTIINVLPKVMSDGSVSLTVAVVVSSIVSQERIQGNNYPVVSARIYYAALNVDSTYTLAVGGLDEAFDASLKSGIPFLKDIPVLGELFKSYDRSQRKKNLMMFITPTILSPRTTVGISEKPESTIPETPNEPTPPSFTTDGMLVGGSAALDNAVRWVVRREQYYAQIVEESRVEKGTPIEIAGVVDVCELLMDQISLMKEARPSEVARYDDFLAVVDRTTDDLNRLRSKAKKGYIGF